jgi:hypothetical protein
VWVYSGYDALGLGTVSGVEPTTDGTCKYMFGELLAGGPGHRGLAAAGQAVYQAAWLDAGHSCCSLGQGLRAQHGQ